MTYRRTVPTLAKERLVLAAQTTTPTVQASGPSDAERTRCTVSLAAPDVSELFYSRLSLQPLSPLPLPVLIVCRCDLELDVRVGQRRVPRAPANLPHRKLRFLHGFVPDRTN